VGGDGERRTLPAAVTYADVVNWQVGISEFTRKSRMLAQLREDAGRDPGSPRRTHAPNFQLFDDNREFRRWRQDERRGISAAEVDTYIRDRGAFYGTITAIKETIEQFIDTARQSRWGGIVERGCACMGVTAGPRQSCRLWRIMQRSPTVSAACSSSPCGPVADS
jgi:hypothetical protein